MALWKNIDKDVISKLFECGYTNKQIEISLGIKSSTVSYWKKKLGILLNQHNNNKEDLYDWDEIQLWYDKGLPINAIVEKFKVPRSTLCKYISKGLLKTRVSKFIDNDGVGIIYVMLSRELNKIKIGITNDLDRRIVAIRMDVPDAIVEFQRSSKYDSVRQCETTTHILFESFNGPIHKSCGYTEWFDIECLDDVIEYLKAYSL